jgi:predicted phosphoribosyltransferase
MKANVAIDGLGRIGRVALKIIPEVPKFVYAVAQVYMNWYDVTDEDVLEIMRKWDVQ